MKFSEMTYTRPDPAASKQRLSALTAELKSRQELRGSAQRSSSRSRS